MKLIVFICTILLSSSCFLLKPLPPSNIEEQVMTKKIPEKEKVNSLRPDLRIDSIKLIEKSSRFSLFKQRNIYLDYTITNIGKAPAKLMGNTPSKMDNIAIRAYFSGDKKLNKGDFLADGFFLPNNTFPNGELAPGQSFSGSMRVSLKSKSRYIAVLLLKIDDFSQLEEEDETNNTIWLILK